MDFVHLRSELSCIIGILPRERTEAQRVVAEVRVGLDLEAVGSTGDLFRGVDYAAFDAWLRFLSTEGQFRLLESFALAALAEIIQGPVVEAEISLSKPDVLRAATPGITIRRDNTWRRSGSVLVDVPEVLVQRHAASPGEVLHAPSFCLDEWRPMPQPHTSDQPRRLVVVTRRPPLTSP